MSVCAAGSVEHLDVELALAYVDGTSTPTERLEVERRMDACSACREVVAAAARGTTVPTKRERPISVRSQPSVQLAAGEVVGRYVVERPIGAGGMGVVCLARDPELRRAVVIKLVRPDAADEDLEARLRREAQAMAQLSHPNVVQIFDIGRHGDRVFLAMEFIAGQTLDAWLIEKPRSVDEIIAMFLQAGAGLEAAHRAGLLHRDFKPTNVLVDRDGVAKVTDFGLARALAQRPSAAMAVPRTSGVHAVLTHADAVVGTPAYMAPEQIAGNPLDARTDQYALALALLDALVGQHPARRVVKASSPRAVLDGALAKVPTRAAIIRALALRPDERWPDLATFLRELAPPRRERRWWPVVALGALGVAAVATAFALREGAVKACVASAPRAWFEVRRDVEARLASRPRVFAAWHAAHVLGAIDNAAAELGALEIAHCEKPPSPADARCLAKRRAALTAGGLVPDDPWSYVRAIASCEPIATTPEPAALRAALAGADATRAREIAERARALDDDLLRADALDRAANLAMARGLFDDAATDFATAAAAGERSGDDALRGRARLGLLELARMRGQLVAARDQASLLDGMLDKHGKLPADVYRVASSAATAWIELGDAPAAFAAIERAAAAAATADERLHVRVLRARALHVLRWDPDGARTEITEAIASAGAASPGARAAAWALAAELALARRDAAAAREAVDAVAGAGAPQSAADERRALHARAATGADAVLAELARPTGDATEDLRRVILRARIRHEHAAHTAAVAELKEAMSIIRGPYSPKSPVPRVGLSALERADAMYLRCEAEVASGDAQATSCGKPAPLDAAHPLHPAHIRAFLAQATVYAASSRSLAGSQYAHAVETLEAAGAKPLLVAEMRLRLVREAPEHWERKEHAIAARSAFAAAGRAAEVAELDQVLATIDGAPLSPPDAGAPRDASGDPWAP